MPKKKCGNCGEEWQVVWLCPKCQNELIDAHEKTKTWRCLVCNQELWLSITGDGRLVGLVCPYCKIIYVFMAVMSI